AVALDLVEPAPDGVAVPEPRLGELEAQVEAVEPAAGPAPDHRVGARPAPVEERVGEDAEEVVLELVEARVVALGVEEREARVEEEGIEEGPADVLEDEHAGGERPGGLAVARALD